MALQSSGQISLGNIATEMTLLAQNISLTAASTSSTLNDASPSKPNESQPHGIAEFYSYDHNYSEGGGVKQLMGSSTNYNTRGKWFESGVCDQDMSFFYSHNGSKNLPVVGDTVYGDNKGNVPLSNGYYRIDVPGGFGAGYAIQAGNNKGIVLLIEECFGGAGPSEPGIGGR